MTKQDLDKLDDLITTLQSITEKTLKLVPSLFDGRARNEEEKRIYKAIAEVIPDNWDAAEFVHTLQFPDSADERYELSLMMELVQELSDRYVALKVLVNDLVPMLTENHYMEYNTVAVCLPYLALLLNQIENNASDLGVWHDENFERLRDRFEYSLKENEDFKIIRCFIDRSFNVYSEKHNSDLVQKFRAFALISLDQYADGDDDVTFAFSFNAGDEASSGVTFRIDRCIEVSMSDYVQGSCGGDSEQLWAFSLSEYGESTGYNGLQDLRASDMGSWKLTIDSPDEYYYYEEENEDEE